MASPTRVLGMSQARSRLISAILLPISWLLRKLGPRPEGDPYHQLFAEFVERVNGLDEARVLEIGGRTAPSGHRPFASHVEVQNLDVHEGPTVDIVGDAHSLSRVVAENSLDAIYTISTFEHLAMPWQVVLEINRVLRQDGLLFVATHPTWPPHALPADYWRFGRAAFLSLLNDATGFAIEGLVEGLPGRVVSLVEHPSMNTLYRSHAPLGVAVVARKTHAYDPRLSWPIAPSSVPAPDTYPVSDRGVRRWQR